MAKGFGAKGFGARGLGLGAGLPCGHDDGTRRLQEKVRAQCWIRCGSWVNFKVRAPRTCSSPRPTKSSEPTSITMRKASADAINAPFQREQQRKQPRSTACERAGCRAEGDYKAPKRGPGGRGILPGQYWRFCLEHVKEYNSRWNYFEGMNPAQMEEQRRADILWGRETYRFGSAENKRKNPFASGEPQFKDSFGFWDQRFGHQQDDERGPFSTGVSLNLSREQREALAVLGLDAPVTAEEVKKRYRFLAKKLHPDLNPDNPHAESQLKSVNDAYAQLKNGIGEVQAA